MKINTARSISRVAIISKNNNSYNNNSKNYSEKYIIIKEFLLIPDMQSLHITSDSVRCISFTHA